MSAYGKAEYWEERYTRDPELFDWYQRWNGIKEAVVNAGVLTSNKILIVGCGNSRLSEEMYDDGYKDIISVDISHVVIKAMQKKYVDKPALIYKQMNCIDMHEFEDESFDAVIDKGTIDSILCSDTASKSVTFALKEISRVLKPGGVYLCVSYGLPNYRLVYLQKEEFNWCVTVKTVQKPLLGITASLAFDEKDSVHYIYICRKLMPGETNLNEMELKKWNDSTESKEE